MSGTSSRGVVAIIFAGLLVTVELVGSKLVTNIGWPYWYITTVALFMSCVALVINVGLARISAPDRYLIMWIALKGFFGGLYWALGIVAVLVGAGPGDVAALLSINIVIAAFLGRAFLGESLRLVHIVALILSLTGATLISKPTFIFQNAEGARGAWVGHVCAASAGLTQSVSFLCSRKAAQANTKLLTLSSMTASTFICIVFICADIVEEAPVQTLLDAPLMAGALILGAIILACGAVSCMCFGAAKCPVAISATAYTAATTIFGYLAQVFLFDAAPQALTIVGACCMFMAVALMALSQACRETIVAVEPACSWQTIVVAPVPVLKDSDTFAHDPEQANTEQREDAKDEDMGNAALGIDSGYCDHDDTGSLASFIASEVTEFTTATGKASKLRQRCSAFVVAVRDVGTIASVAAA